MAFDLAIEPASSPVAAALVAALDLELTRRYPGLPIYGIDAPGFEERGGVFVVAYEEGVPAGCGAFRRHDGAAEIKRMYVAPEFRRRGLGKQILRFLVNEAARLGFPRAILETGTGQPEAIKLYTEEGWTPVPVFGPYVGDPLSVCFEKRLDGRSRAGRARAR